MNINQTDYLYENNINNHFDKEKNNLLNLEVFIKNKKLDETEILDIIWSITCILREIEKRGYILGSVNLSDFWILNGNLKDIRYKSDRRYIVAHDTLYKYKAGSICTPEITYFDIENINKATDVNIIGRILVKLIFNNRIKYSKESEERYLSYNLNLFDLNLPLELHTFIGKTTSIYNEERYESVDKAAENLHTIISNFYKNRRGSDLINLTPRLIASGKTHVGNLKLEKNKMGEKDPRQLNEDSALILKGTNNKLFFMIADGVSNASFGNGYIASNIIKKVCEYYWKQYQSEIINKMEVNNFFYRIIRDSNQQIFNYIKDELSGIDYDDFLKTKGIMSSTFTSGIIIGNKLYYISLGDSPLYIFSKDSNLTLLNNEDNLGKTALRYYMSIDRYNEISSKSSLTKYIGKITYKEEKFEPKENIIKLKEFVLLDQDIIIACSDGLTDYIDASIRDKDPWSADMTLRDILLGGTTDIDKINQTLVKTANENGGGDNITSILIKYILDEN